MITRPRASLLVGSLLMMTVGVALAQAPADTTAAPPSVVPAPHETPIPVDTTAAPPSAVPAPHETPIPVDTSAVVAPIPTAPIPTAADSAAADTAHATSVQDAELIKDRDRFELGVAKVKGGDYDFLGTLAYHRYLRHNEALEHWLHLEFSAGKADQITEIATSAAYLFRPVIFTKRTWAIQPIIEFGPAMHLVGQIAEIEGFGENAFHVHVYLKLHAFAGLEVPLGAHFGVVTRGRFTVPSHHPADYAQIALFLR